MDYLNYDLMNRFIRLPDAAAAREPAQPSGKGTFAQVLRQAERDQEATQGPIDVPGEPVMTPTAPTTSTGVSAARTDGTAQDLIQPIKRAQSEEYLSNVLVRELIKGPNRRSQLLREALQGAGRTPTGTDLKKSLGRVESEWYQVEEIMKSDRELSDGELLGLQARLYQVSQHLEVMSKVVDQMTSGVKTILNTNL
jgi:hypothetical protein